MSESNSSSLQKNLHFYNSSFEEKASLELQDCKENLPL